MKSCEENKEGKHEWLQPVRILHGVSIIRADREPEKYTEPVGKVYCGKCHQLLENLKK